eukprot:COSAG03_NODE_2176_length_3045_cov_1.792261_1_plen_899_part_01
MPRVAAADEPLLPAAARRSQETSFLRAPAGTLDEEEKWCDEEMETDGAGAQLPASLAFLVDARNFVGGLYFLCLNLWLWSSIMRQLYFGDTDGSSGQECIDNENSRETVAWVVGTAPLWARNFLLMAALVYCCRKSTGLPGGGGVLEALLCGDSSRDDEVDMTGWFAIVGDHSGDRAQCTWTEARDARRMSQKQAIVLGGAKLLLWHWSQPGAFLWLLYVFRCEVTALGPTQQSLAAVVATREVLYLGSTLLAVAKCPAFLLLDVRTVLKNYAATWMQKATQMPMFFLCPHNVVAMSLLNRFRTRVHVFMVLAGVQVMADVSSCIALVHLLAASIETPCDIAITRYSYNSSAVGEHCMARRGHEQHGPGCEALDWQECNEFAPHHCVWGCIQPLEVGPLTLGYSITAFGFLLFFGPLSIVSSVKGALDRQRHCIVRALNGLAGSALLAVDIGVYVLLLWLLIDIVNSGNHNPFCSEFYSEIFGDPCSGNGHCYGPALCKCNPGYGPENKNSGLDLCSECATGWRGDLCELPTTPCGALLPTKNDTGCPPSQFGDPACTARCNPGFSGLPMQLDCNVDGKWKGVRPTCYKTPSCEELGDIDPFGLPYDSIGTPHPMPCEQPTRSNAICAAYCRLIRGSSSGFICRSSFRWNPTWLNFSRALSEALDGDWQEDINQKPNHTLTGHTHKQYYPRCRAPPVAGCERGALRRNYQIFWAIAYVSLLFLTSYVFRQSAFTLNTFVRIMCCSQFRTKQVTAISLIVLLALMIVFSMSLNCWWQVLWANALIALGLVLFIAKVVLHHGSVVAPRKIATAVCVIVLSFAVLFGMTFLARQYTAFRHKMVACVAAVSALCVPAVVRHFNNQMQMLRVSSRDDLRGDHSEDVKDNPPEVVDEPHAGWTAL